MLITIMEKVGTKWKAIKEKATWNESEIFVREKIGEAVVVRITDADGENPGYFCCREEEYLTYLERGRPAFLLTHK